MVAKMQRFHIPNVGEGMMFKPGGSPYQYDDEERFPLGAYIRLGNKGFVYGHSAGITSLQYGSKPQAIIQPVGWSTVAASVAAGVTEITFDLGASAGPAGDGNIAVDYLKWGEACIMPAWGTGFTIMILGNTVITGDGGGVVTLTLASPIPTACTVDVAHIECIPSPYRSLVSPANDPLTQVVGMPTCVAVAGKYLWLQVEGPFGIAAAADVGNSSDRLQAVFKGNGTIGPHDYNDAAEGYNQHAGTIMFPAQGGGQGTPFINLQIAH